MKSHSRSSSRHSAAYLPPTDDDDIEVEHPKSSSSDFDNGARHVNSHARRRAAYVPADSDDEEDHSLSTSESCVLSGGHGSGRLEK